MSGFAITKCARRATRIGGHLGSEEKSATNRSHRRHVRQELHRNAELADLGLRPPKKYTGWDVI